MEGSVGHNELPCCQRLKDDLLCTRVEAPWYGPNVQAEECFDIPNDEC